MKADEDQSYKLFRRDGQIRGLRNASSFFRIIGGLVAIYIFIQGIRLIQFPVNRDWWSVTGQLLLGAFIFVGIWAFALLLDVAAEILGDVTYITKQFRQREEQKQQKIKTE